MKSGRPPALNDLMSGLINYIDWLSDRPLSLITDLTFYLALYICNYFN